jgi:hypothetical protein
MSALPKARNQKRGQESEKGTGYFL